METQRQKKIAGVIQKDLAEVLQRTATGGGSRGTLISVTKVYVTTDLADAKVYVSIFPNDKSKELLGDIKGRQSLIKHELAKRARHQFRRMPN
jgi:ribosome-binding factor A